MVRTVSFVDTTEHTRTQRTHMDKTGSSWLGIYFISKNNDLRSSVMMQYLISVRNFQYVPDFGEMIFLFSYQKHLFPSGS